MGVIYTFELLLELQQGQLAMHKVQHYVDSKITSWDDKTELEKMVGNMWLVPPDDVEVNDVMIRSKTKRVLNCMLLSEITVDDQTVDRPLFKEAGAGTLTGNSVVASQSKD